MFLEMNWISADLGKFLFEEVEVLAEKLGKSAEMTMKILMKVMKLGFLEESLNGKVEVLAEKLLAGKLLAEKLLAGKLLAGKLLAEKLLAEKLAE